MKKGSLYLIPCPIVDGKYNSLSPEISQTIRKIKSFVVERARTSRRFIKALCPEINISELNIFELDKKNPYEGLSSFLEQLMNGQDVGVLSEAGCPGIADPGNQAVVWCHQNGISVRPLVGPSSIVLALMGSGFNGQNFAFNGYLSNKKPELIQQLRQLENRLIKYGQTQLFMDAPYRNGFLLEHCLRSLKPETKLCVACDLDSDNATIVSQPIKQWSLTAEFHKRPAIFLIGR